MKNFILSISFLAYGAVAVAGSGGYDCDTKTWNLGECNNGTASLNVCVKNNKGAFVEVAGFKGAGSLNCASGEKFPLQALVADICKRSQLSETKNGTFSFPEAIALVVSGVGSNSARNYLYKSMDVSSVLEECK